MASRRFCQSGRSVLQGLKGLVHLILCGVRTPPGGSCPLVGVASQNVPPLGRNLVNDGMLYFCIA